MHASNAQLQSTAAHQRPPLLPPLHGAATHGPVMPQQAASGSTSGAEPQEPVVHALDTLTSKDVERVVDAGMRAQPVQTLLRGMAEVRLRRSCADLVA